MEGEEVDAGDGDGDGDSDGDGADGCDEGGASSQKATASPGRPKRGNNAKIPPAGLTVTKQKPKVSKRARGGS